MNTETNEQGEATEGFFLLQRSERVWRLVARWHASTEEGEPTQATAEDVFRSVGYRVDWPFAVRRASAAVLCPDLEVGPNIVTLRAGSRPPMQ